MTERLVWKTFLGQWFIACAATQLLQIWGDGFASWILLNLGAGGVTGGISLLFGLTVLRLVSAALGGMLQSMVSNPYAVFRECHGYDDAPFFDVAEVHVFRNYEGNSGDSAVGYIATQDFLGGLVGTAERYWISWGRGSCR